MPETFVYSVIYGTVLILQRKFLESPMLPDDSMLISWTPIDRMRLKSCLRRQIMLANASEEGVAHGCDCFLNDLILSLLSCCKHWTTTS